MSFMNDSSFKYDRVPAMVFACLIDHEFKIVLFPGYGMANGGISAHVDTKLIPFELRMPNTPIWVKLDCDKNIIKVWKREAEAIYD